MTDLNLLEQFIKEALLDEAKKKKKKSAKRKTSKKGKKKVARKKKKTSNDKKKYPGNPNYYKGLTDAEKKIMAREVRKCSKNPKPKACYNYPWPAEKRIDKLNKKSK
jgi:hypothetical protein